MHKSCVARRNALYMDRKCEIQYASVSYSKERQ